MFKLAYGVAIAIVAGSILWFISGRWEPSQIVGLSEYNDPVKVSVELKEDGSGVLIRTVGEKSSRFEVRFSHAEGVSVGPTYELKFLSGSSDVPIPSIRLNTHAAGPDVLFCDECKQVGVALPVMWRITRKE